MKNEFAVAFYSKYDKLFIEPASAQFVQDSTKKADLL